MTIWVQWMKVSLLEQISFGDSTLYPFLNIVSIGRGPGWLANHFNFCFVIFSFHRYGGSEVGYLYPGGQTSHQTAILPLYQGALPTDTTGPASFLEKVACHYCDNWQRIQRSPTQVPFRAIGEKKWRKQTSPKVAILRRYTSSGEFSSHFLPFWAFFSHFLPRIPSEYLKITLFWIN